MKFSVDEFKNHGIFFPHAFNMKYSLNLERYHAMENEWKKLGLSVEKTYKGLKKRTTSTYYNDILSAQSSALSYAESVFPAYRFLLPDVLIDDWLSIVDPHKEGKRDHSLHQPLSTFIVSQLLGNGNPADSLKIGGISLLSFCAQQFNESPKMQYVRRYFLDLYPKGFPPKGIIRQKWAEAVFYQTAIVASLFHDIGYPWQYIYKIRSGIMPAHPVIDQRLFTFGESLFRQIEDRLLIYPFYGYSYLSKKLPTVVWRNDSYEMLEKAFSGTHGMPGALAFQYLNDCLRKFPASGSSKEAVLRLIQDWAAVGILMHDMVREYHGCEPDPKKPTKPAYPHLRLSIDTDPLSCLIAMADILEEFGRPAADFSSKEQSVTLGYSYPCIRTEVDTKDDTMTITYIYAKGKLDAKKKKWRENEIYSYFDSKIGYVDLSELGINKVECKVLEDKGENT